MKRQILHLKYDHQCFKLFRQKLYCTSNINRVLKHSRSGGNIRARSSRQQPHFQVPAPHSSDNRQLEQRSVIRAGVRWREGDIVRSRGSRQQDQGSDISIPSRVTVQN